MALRSVTTGANQMYDAFISYSHKADSTLAKSLQHRLERWARPWYSTRTAKLFRDQVSLTATPHLWKTIAESLDRSKFLILLASIESVKSEWVPKEISYWLTAGKCEDPDTLSPGDVVQTRVEHLAIVLTDGEIKWDSIGNDFARPATTSLHPVLQRLTWRPLWLDLRWARGMTPEQITTDDRFTEVVLKLLSSIRGQTPQELLDANDKEQRRAVALFRRLALGLAIALALALTGALVAWNQRNLAETSRQAAQSSEKATRSQLYDVRATQVEAAWNTGWLDRMPSLLRAGHTNTPEDLRGFEWFLYKRASDAQVVSQSSSESSLLGCLRIFCVSPDGEWIALGWENGVTVVNLPYLLRSPSVLYAALQPSHRIRSTSEQWRRYISAVEGVVAFLPGVVPEAMVFSNDCKYLATGGRSSFLYSTDSWEGRAFPDTPEVRSISMSGDVIAIGCYDASVRLLRLPDLHQWHALRGHSKPVASVDVKDYSGDFLEVASGSIDGNVRIWTISGDSFSHIEFAHDVLPGKHSAVNNVKFSPSGRILASAGDDGTVVLRDAFGRPKYLPTSQFALTDVVLSLAFSPDSSVLLAGDRSGVITMNSLSTVAGPKVLTTRTIRNVGDLDVKMMGSASVFPEAVRHIEYVAPSHTIAALSGLGRLRVFDSTYLNLGFSPRWRGHDTSLNNIPLGMKFSDDDSSLYVAEQDYISISHKEAGQWSGFSSTRKERTSGAISVVQLHENETPTKQTNTILCDSEQGDILKVIGYCLSPNVETLSPTTALEIGFNNELAATGHADGNVSIINLKTRKLLSSFTDRSEIVSEISLIPHSPLVATCGDSNEIRLRNYNKKTIEHTLSGHARRVTCLVAAADGRRLFSGSDDGTVRIWDVSTGNSLAVLDRHKSGVTCLALSKDGSVLASGGQDKNVVFWIAPRP